MTETRGVDYSAGRPGGAALAKAGVKFACRYLSHTASKNLTPAEAADLAAHGVSSVVVWETTANRAGAGRAAGITDAQEALAQAKACGMPSGRPIYFAVDWDANPAIVAPYFQGVASVLGLRATGGYGGFKVIRYLLDNRLISWAWQTAAWSAGHWDARAVLRQPATTTHIGGVSCDWDTATAADYGQWMPGKIPSLEDDVAWTDRLTIAKGPWSDKAQTATAEDWLMAGNLKAGAAVAGVQALTAQVGALTKLVAEMATALAKGGGLTAEQAEAAAKAGAQAALAELGDTLTKEA